MAATLTSFEPSLQRLLDEVAGAGRVELVHQPQAARVARATLDVE